MEELSLWLKEAVDRTVLFWLYGKVFRMSHIEENSEVWVDMQEIGHSTNVRVKSAEELVIYIQNHVQVSPLLDEVIMFDVKNVVCNNLHRQCDSEE